MGVISKFVKIKVTKSMVTKYRLLGYECEQNEEITVKLEHLNKSSKVLIDCQCDFCGIYFQRAYNSIAIDKHPQWVACPKCVGEKRREICRAEYGVDNWMQVEKLKQKLFETNMEKYGCKIGLLNPDVREKQIQTCIKKYGTAYQISSKQTREKIINTFKEKYNVVNPSQIDEVMTKIQQTRYKDGLQASSKQQRALCQYFNGELNYPFGRRYIDIALPDKMIAIEYNGGGHTLAVKLGDISESEFVRNENFRRKQLFEGGWKLIEFVTETNKVTDEYTSKQILRFCLNLFNHHYKHHIIVDLDKNKITNGDGTICYKYTLNDWNERTSLDNNNDGGTV